MVFTVVMDAVVSLNEQFVDLFHGTVEMITNVLWTKQVELIAVRADLRNV